MVAQSFCKNTGGADNKVNIVSKRAPEVARLLCEAGTDKDKAARQITMPLDAGA